MAKTKTPFFGLASSGSVAGAITTQRSGSLTHVRSKPHPAFTYTLPQAYQRWLYQDYAYLWTQQSSATRQTYQTLGTRHHLTGFQYWMKYHLAKLPDIVAWWKLDDNQGATTIDSSRNGYTATIFGASPAAGLISGALSFDGVNDYLTAVSSWTPTQSLTLLFFLNPAAGYGQHDHSFIMTKARIETKIDNLTGFVWAEILNTLFASVTVYDTLALTIGQGYAFAVTFDYSDNRLRLYRNGNYIARSAVLPGTPANASAFTFLIGGNPAANRCVHGTIDNYIILQRLLDTTEIARWAERRYPPQ